MPLAARVGDNVIQDAPHCHAPIHPPAPTPTAVPHPAMPLAIVKGASSVTIGGSPAAVVTSQTVTCMLATCVPGGPGVVVQGSSKVMIEGLPAARVGDKTAHASCIGPIPAPTGSIQGPGCATVNING